MIRENIFEHTDEDGDEVVVRAFLAPTGEPVILLCNDPFAPGEGAVSVRLFPAEVHALINALVRWYGTHGMDDFNPETESPTPTDDYDPAIRLEALRLAVQVVPATRDVALRATETAREFEAYLRGTQ